MYECAKYSAVVLTERVSARAGTHSAHDSDIKRSMGPRLREDDN